MQSCGLGSDALVNKPTPPAAHVVRIPVALYSPELMEFLEILPNPRLAKLHATPHRQ
jgi:hypothetical protein